MTTYRIHEPLTRGRAYTRDALLRAEPLPRNPDMLGHLIWQGDLKPLGEAVAAVKFELARIKDKARLGDAIAKAVSDIAEFGTTGGAMGRGPAGSLSTTGNESFDRPEREFNTVNPALPSSVNALNADFWAKEKEKSGGQATQDRASVARDIARTTDVSTRATPQSINAANRAFHANRAPFRLGGQWGKG